MPGKQKLPLTDGESLSKATWGFSALGVRLNSLLLFFVSWCVTYTKAYVNGDDIVHMQGDYGSRIFLPAFEHSWIPNRVVDTYGRNLLVHLFDSIYFPLKSLAGVDFFLFFKIFNATLFSLFLVVVQRYVTNQVAVPGWSLQEREERPSGGTLIGLYIALLVLLIFPWVNEVQFVCYQLPAFVGFVVLAELFKRMAFWRLPEYRSLPAPWLAVLIFLVAFSLEAYSAILLAVIALALVCHWPKRLRDAWHDQGFVLSIFLAACCGVALLIAAVYSQRSAVTAHLPVAGQVADFFLASGKLSQDARQCCRNLLLGFAGLVLFLGFFVFLRRRNKADSISSTIENAESFSLVRWVWPFLIVLFSTVVVTSLISLKAGYNYFDIHNYPWGGFLLIAELFGVLALLVPLAWLRRGSFIADAARILLVILLISSAAIRVLDGVPQHYAQSLKIREAYRMAQVDSVTVFDTGLSLDAIPMTERPLPTAASPSWFRAGYVAFFKKYYGVSTTVVFK